MSQGGNLYEAVLRDLAGATPSGGMPPARASASVVPWRFRDEGEGATAAAGSSAVGAFGAFGAMGGIEVFWVRRADALPFMGGWHAFPGGGVARSDAAVEVAGAPAGLDPFSFTPPDPLASHEEVGPDLVPGLAACALRELFEETGLLLAEPAPPPAALAAARQALLAGEPFTEVLRGLGAVATAERLVYAGRWLTPPFAPLRFDSRFFLLEWPREEEIQPQVIAGELTAGEWVEPRAAWWAWHRGDVLAAPPILHLLTVLHEEGPRTGLPRLLDTHKANLGPLRQVELRPGVLMFPLATATLPPAATTNAYLLGHGEAVLVDPGAAGAEENERLVEALTAARRQRGREVTAIWLTHHHPDHVGGVAQLRRRLGVPVLAHATTAARLAERGIPVDAELHDGERVVLAGEPPLPVRVVHTPGHARGHLCFFDEAGGSLLAGDMVAGIGTIVVDPPEGNMDDYLRSLEKLLALAPRTLFPGHGPAVRDAPGKLREYIEHRLWRESRVLAAWNEGRRLPAEMLPTVYDDAPKEALPLAERQVLAHLARLQRAGKIH